MSDSRSAPGATGVRSGPLTGVRVLEMAGLGPAPFCAMLLSDLGADVVRVDRPSGPSAGQAIPMVAAGERVLGRGRRSVALDLKSPGGLSTATKLAGAADILIEGFRPGVMERIGLGPDTLLQRNPKLVYGSMTGWGRDGAWAKMAGQPSPVRVRRPGTTRGGREPRRGCPRPWSRVGR